MLMAKLKGTRILTTLEIINGNSTLHFNADIGYTALFRIIFHYQITKYMMIFRKSLRESEFIVTNLFELYGNSWIPLTFARML